MTTQGRIIFEGGIEVGNEYCLGGAALENLLVWRPRLAAAVTISDALGRLFRARVVALSEAGAQSARVYVFEEAGVERRPPLDLTLLQSLPEKERMELIIQKTTELGISRIVPFKSQRSISLDEREKAQRKSHKWREIALKASKQARRADIAEVLPYTSFDDALNMAQGSDLKIMLSERRDAAPLRGFLNGKKAVNAVAVLSGPEGGFTDEEVGAASNRGFTPVSLGNRILRAETAPIIAIGILQYELGC